MNRYRRMYKCHWSRRHSISTFLYTFVLLLIFSSCSKPISPLPLPASDIEKQSEASLKEQLPATAAPTAISIAPGRQPCGAMCPKPTQAALKPQSRTNSAAVTAPVSPLTAGPIGLHMINTANNIHLFLTFSYNISDPASIARYYDFVWGADLDQVTSFRSGNPQILLSYYTMFHRDDGTFNDENALQSVDYWKSNHPDWILYRCDRTTPAYEDGQNMPFDFTNPEVINYQIQQYALPASQSGYDALAVDNLNLENIGGGCGFYRNGQWVQRYTGQTDDPTYIADVISWLSQMQARLHALPHPLALIPNLSLQPLSPSDPQAQQVADHIDGITSEGGFTNYGAGYLTDNDWLQTIQFIQRFQSQGKPFYSTNEFGAGSPDSTQRAWAIASYLMGNEGRAAIFMSGSQQYGSDTRYPEYSAQIGTPTGAMYSAQGVYWRTYTNGLVVVNPSNANSYTVTTTIPHTDMDGNAVGTSFTLQPHSGLVLLNR